MMPAIGGFLPLRLPAASSGTDTVLTRWLRDGDRSWLLNNGRSALHALWSAARPARIWLPAYICAEVAAAAPHGIESSYYPLDATLAPDVDFLASQIRDGDHVLAVDYFGRLVSPELIKLVEARRQVGWIEDRAHALDPGVAWGDWLLYSPRKLFGVPDGGLLVARRKPLPELATIAPLDLSFALPCLARFEDRHEVDNDRWYRDYLRSEAAMAIGTQAMSRLAETLLDTYDVGADSEIRRRNYEVLHDELREWAFLPERRIAFAPLGMPIRVDSAEQLSRRLSERRIFAARHWASLPSDPSRHAVEHRLASQLLTLPCDYRYRAADMHAIAIAVREALQS